MPETISPSELDEADAALYFARIGLDDAIENYINARIKSELEKQQNTEKEND